MRTTKAALFGLMMDDQRITEELSAKTARNITMRTHMARFPFVKRGL